MLPSADAAWVGEELARRFGLPAWQLAMSATDANRFVLRFARHLTGRPRIAVMDWCYHGTVDETLAVLDGDRVVPRPGALGPQVDVARHDGGGAVQRRSTPSTGGSPRATSPAC